MIMNMSKGQAIVVVLLVLAIALTLGISLANKTTSETSISTAQEESQKALQKAESGLEQVLSGGNSALVTNGTLSTNKIISPTLYSGESITVNTPTSGFKICSSVSDVDFEINKYTGVNIEKEFISSTLASDSTNTCPTNKPYIYSYTLSGNPDKIVIRVYNVSTSGVLLEIISNSGNFSNEGNVYTAKSIQGQTQKAIEVQERNDIPSIFDFVLFSGGKIE